MVSNLNISFLISQCLNDREEGVIQVPWGGDVIFGMQVNSILFNIDKWHSFKVLEMHITEIFNLYHEVINANCMLYEL